MKLESICQVTVATTFEAEEPVAALLERIFGQPPSVYENVESGEIWVTVYVREPLRELKPRKAEILEGFGKLKDLGLDPGPPQVQIRRVPRKDWSESWKKYFKTIWVGSALMIRPSWSKEKPGKGQAVVVLDPGLSFGTGQHATTSFCLREIVRSRGVARSLLDIGTGSGILAISASKLGYHPVEAFDFDPIAVRVALANCRRNRVEHRVRVRRQDLTKLKEANLRKYDVVCANLISTLLLDEQPTILNRLAPGGLLVLAGILETEFPRVRQSYARAGLELVHTRKEREWQSGSFRFRS